MQRQIARFASIGEQWLLVAGWRRTLIIAATAVCYGVLYAVALFRGGVAPIVATLNFFLIVISAATLRIPGSLAAATLSAILVGPLVGDYLALPGYAIQFHWTFRFIAIELFGLLAGAVSEVIRHQAESLRNTTERFLRAQKMEAVGQLASGIAHDFNNILTVITGFGEVTLRQLGSDHPAYGSVRKILDAAHRGATLSHQILAYSRRQILSPSIVDLNEVIEDLKGMLERITGEKISLRVSADPALKPAKIDSSKLERVIMNLTVNARDAIEGTGTIRFNTQNVDLTPGHPDFRPEMAPGPYVLMSVADTGSGMSPEVARRVFEPFFSTKPRGTGLGLSTVYGIVKQSKGYIYVESAPGNGTTFKIFLPVAEGVSTERSRTPTCEGPVGGQGRERILFVEDDEEISSLMKDALIFHGYSVVTATSASDALAAYEKSGSRIDLLVADIVLPDRDGFELSRRLTEQDPGLKTLFVTGYGRGCDPEPIEADGRATILEKPYGVGDLIRHVRLVLDHEVRPHTT